MDGPDEENELVLRDAEGRLVGRFSLSAVPQVSIEPKLAGPMGVGEPGGGPSLPDIGIAEEIVSAPQVAGADREPAEEPAELLCPPSELGEEELREAAGRLHRAQGGAYWRSFNGAADGSPGRAVLMGWIRFRCKCAYCCKNLADPTQMLGLGNTDHLLPRGAYPELNYLQNASAYLNAVPCCAPCNRIKRAFDPNGGVDIGTGQRYDPVYDRSRDESLTPEMQIELIRRAEAHIKEERKRLLRFYAVDVQNWENLQREMGL